MDIERNFIALIRNFKGRKDSLVMALDAYGLSWLIEQLTALASDQTKQIVVGDGKPVLSDDKINLTVILTDAIKRGALTSLGLNAYILNLATHEAYDLVQIISPLTENRPAHQYLDFGYQECDMLISVGEYTADQLRLMQ